jgi:hypothetical protein
MAMHIILDVTGDTRRYFDRDDIEDLAEAERRFEELTGKGFTAAVRAGTGEASRIHAFDPTVEETLFFPRLVGG